MAMSHVNFVSYNSTGLNEVKIKWIRDLCFATSSSFVGIQEHFRKNKNIDETFASGFPEHNCYVVPGHRDSGQDRGRPKGGLAQLINRTFDIKVTTINCDNFRLQAQIISFPNTTLLWMNVYFPTDSQNLNSDTTELVTTLKVIENVMDNNTFDDILIQGDLNWDSRRDSGHSLIMKEFTERIGVKSVWERFPVSFTHIHTDMKSTSVLDNFLVNERLLDYIVDAGVMHLGDNLSRHSPILKALCR